MRKLLVPTSGPSDWRRLLANPATQWRAGKSAFELAVAWEAVRTTLRGIPLDVAALLDRVPDLRDATLLLAIPEHQVDLDGGGHASQTDLWALLSAPVGLVSVAVEAKAGESFDVLVSEWLADIPQASGKPLRLRQLCDVLRLTHDVAATCRYQLLHRPVSAILEAKRFGAGHALFLVQAFTSDKGSVDDYIAFGGYLGADLKEGAIVSAGERAGVHLWIGWVPSATAEAATLRAAL